MNFWNGVLGSIAAFVVIQVLAWLWRAWQKTWKESSERYDHKRSVLQALIQENEHFALMYALHKLNVNSYKNTRILVSLLASFFVVAALTSKSISLFYLGVLVSPVAVYYSFLVLRIVIANAPGDEALMTYLTKCSETLSEKVVEALSGDTTPSS